MSEKVYNQIAEDLREAIAEVRKQGIVAYGPFNLRIEPIKPERNNITKT